MAVELRRFIEEKQKLEEDHGFRLFALQEMDYFEDLSDLYCDKLLKMEERLLDVVTNTPDKMNNFLKHSFAKKRMIGDSTGWKLVHVASSAGYSGEVIAHLGEIKSSETNANKRDNFMEVFKAIVSSKEMIPDKSCILLYTHDYRMATTKRIHKKETKLEAVAKSKGQTVLTSFFPKTKTPAIASPSKKPEKIPKYRLEKVLQDLRGDKVKILWIPSGHYDLDPSQYVTVHLRNEIALAVGMNDEEVDFKTSFDQAFSRLPADIWSRAFEFMEDAISFYLNGGNAVNNEQEPSGLKLEEPDEVPSDQETARHSSTDKENFEDIEVKVEIEEETFG